MSKAIEHAEKNSTTRKYFTHYPFDQSLPEPACRLLRTPLLQTSIPVYNVYVQTCLTHRCEEAICTWTRAAHIYEHQEVARVARVSTATVSRTINGSDKVSP